MSHIAYPYSVVLATENDKMKTICIRDTCNNII